MRLLARARFDNPNQTARERRGPQRQARSRPLDAFTGHGGMVTAP